MHRVDFSPSGVYPARMPRKSEAAKLTPAPTPIGKFPPPPRTLNERESVIWDAIVRTKPCDWFQADTLPLLESYCCHVARAQMLDALLREFDPKTLAKETSAATRFEGFRRARESETRAALALARSMRMTHQAQYDHQKAFSRQKSAAKGQRPWESKT